jgi:hypothetical protein
MAKAFKIERRGRPKKTPLARQTAHEQQILEARVIAFKQPHRQEAPENKRDDPKACWPLGILNLCGAISDLQYQAGVLYGRDVRRYRAHYLADVPDPSPASIAGFMQPQGGFGRAVSDDDALKVKEAYNGAVNAVMNAGQRAAKVVARMAVFGERCPVGGEAMLNIGLSALSDHYGLTRRRK